MVMNPGYKPRQVPSKTAKSAFRVATVGSSFLTHCGMKSHLKVNIQSQFHLANTSSLSPAIASLSSPRQWMRHPVTWLTKSVGPKWLEKSYKYQRSILGDFFSTQKYWKHFRQCTEVTARENRHIQRGGLDVLAAVLDRSAMAVSHKNPVSLLYYSWFSISRGISIESREQRKRSCILRRNLKVKIIYCRKFNRNLLLCSKCRKRVCVIRMQLQ